MILILKYNKNYIIKMKNLFSTDDINIKNKITQYHQDEK